MRWPCICTKGPAPGAGRTLYALRSLAWGALLLGWYLEAPPPPFSSFSPNAALAALSYIPTRHRDNRDVYKVMVTQTNNRREGTKPTRTVHVSRRAACVLVFQTSWLRGYSVVVFVAVRSRKFSVRCLDARCDGS